MNEHISSSPTDRPGDGASPTELTENERHRLLASEHRRAVIDVLADRPRPMDLEELAVAVSERDPGGDHVGRDRAARMAVSLHHVHLPKMDDVGIVDYDPVTKRVVPKRFPPTR